MTAWLFTFLVHSTIWCGVAWLGLRFFPRTHARTRETIWYTVLAASLITPTVHTLTLPDSAVWRLPVPALMADGEHHGEGEAAHGEGGTSVSVPPGEDTHGDEASASPGWLAPAGVLWLAVTTGLLALYLLRMGKLRRRIRDREPVTTPRLSREMAALSGRASLVWAPRLTESHTLGSPVALGVGRRREICVPVRARHELDEAQFRALLGHEMAHHLRRDTIRLAMLNILQAVFFFQPLFRLAARELRLAAEELCDDWAAGQLDDRLAVASCLTEVARWVVPSDRRVPVPCIGRGPSQLKRRVRRMLNEQYSLRASRRATSNRWRRMGALGLLALASLFAPAVAPGADEIHDGRALEGPASAREHRQSREHGLRERREHSPVRPAQATAAVGEHEPRAINTIFSANLGHEAIEED